MMEKKLIANRIIFIICVFNLLLYGCVPMKKPPKVHVETWWKLYKKNFILPDGRVQRPEHDFDTVSEGQAYAMVFSAFMNDKKTFDLIYDWTEKRLSRKNKTGDRLLAWHWKEGSVTDWMPASDADGDYAFALLLASYRWKEKNYEEKALQVANDLLRLETVRGIDNRLFLLPGLWGNEKNGYLVQNPSYYSPAAFHMFYEITKDSQWLDLIETGYWILNQSGLGLGELKGCGLIPDWCAVDSNGKILLAEGKSSDYGWEAIRIPMRIGIDKYWYNSERAGEILEKVYKALQTTNSGHREIKATYRYTGEPSAAYSSLASIAMTCFIAQIHNFNVDELKALLVNKFNEESFATNYYSQSLAFFPLAFENRVLEKP